MESVNNKLIEQREKEAERRRKAQEAKTKAQKEAEAAKAEADKKKNLEQSGPTIFDEKDRFKPKVDIPVIKPKEPKPPKKEPKGTKGEKGLQKYFAPKVKKGVGSGFALNKGGLASKPQPKPKKKRTTKGLGTKPKAT